MSEKNLNFSFDVNVSGVRAATGGPVTEVPEGFYKATITDAYTLTDKPNRVAIALTIADGPCAGAVRTHWVGLQDNQRVFIRAVLESAGYTPAQLDVGAIKFTRETIVGKTAYLYYRPKNPSAGIQYDDTAMLTPKDFAVKSAAFAKAQEAGALNGIPAPGPALNLGSSGPAAPTVGASLSSALGSTGAATPGVQGLAAGDLMSALNIS